jgi:hypothetical protein
MAELTAKRRKDLPKSSFALPGKGEGPQGKGAGSYPIPDQSHARNALTRVSQHGSPEEKKQVRAAVARKFPGIEQSPSRPGVPSTGDLRSKGPQAKRTGNSNGRIARELGSRLAARDRS